MKWIGLFLLLAAVMPFSGWLRANPRHILKVWMLIGFLPFVMYTLHLYMAAIAWNEWPSYVRGFEFSVIDALVLTVYLTLPNAHRPLPFRLSMLLYFCAVLLSAIPAPVPEATLFYCWQLGRMFLVYVVVTRACTDPRVAPAILTGMGTGLVMEAGVAIWQRFGLGVLQTPGTLVHQNFLGMMSFFVVFPFFSQLVAGRGGWRPLLITLAGCVAEVLTVSRATIAIAFLGFLIIFITSSKWQWTSRKASILLIGALVVVGFMPLIFASMEGRGSVEIENSDSDRAVLVEEAKRIISDHPLGVGANQYVVVARNNGYRQPGPGWGVEIHNVYLIVAAETGLLGLFFFVIFLSRPLVVAFRCAWHNRGHPNADLLLGLGVALLAVYIHGLFEFGFLDYVAQYAFALEVGMVVGLARQLGYWGQPHLRSDTLAVSAMRPISRRSDLRA